MIRTRYNRAGREEAQVAKARARSEPARMSGTLDHLPELPDAPPFADAQPMTAEATLINAEAHYEVFMPSASRRLELADYAAQRGFSKEAAFELHQAAELLYNAFLLVITSHTPRTHSLVRLRQMAEQIDAKIAEVWPTDAKFQKRCFEPLRAAYIKARYWRTYRVTPEELTWMRERIELLRVIVIDSCQDRLSVLRTDTARNLTGVSTRAETATVHTTF